MNEMTQMPWEPKRFGEQVAEIFRRHYPAHAVELVAPLDIVVEGKHVGLENLYRMALRDPDRGMEIVENHVDRLIEADTGRPEQVPLSVAKTRIMPRIQPVTIFEHLDEDQVAHIPFVNDTVIVFVQDLPQMTLSIRVEQMRGWGLGLDELDNIARKNLDAYENLVDFKFVDSPEGGRAAIIAQQDGYDAARLLLGSLHARLAPELGGDFYVATPARDMFLALTFGPDEFIERMHKRVRSEFNRLPYPITDRLFVVTRDGVAGTEA